MASKGKKVKKNKNNKMSVCSSNNSSIPDLPKSDVRYQRYVCDVGYQRYVCDGGLTKSWRISPKQCMHSSDGTPKLWLEVNDTSKTNRGLCSFGYSYSNFPKRDKKNLIWCAMGSVTSDDYLYIIVLTGISHPAFLFNRNGNSAWSEHDCNIADPFCSNNFMQFTSGVHFRGKFYVLSLQGTLAVIDVIDHCPRITALGSKRVVPDCGGRHFREYLFKHHGEVLLVFLVSRKTINVVDHVQVFKLDVSRLLFVKLESIGDRTLFVGANCCSLVSKPSKSQFPKTDCVYFTQHRLKEGWMACYDMLRGSISLVDVHQMANDVKREYHQAKAKKKLQLLFKDRSGNSGIFPVLR